MGLYDTTIKRLVHKIEGVIIDGELTKQSDFYVYVMGSDIVKSEADKVYIDYQLADCDPAICYKLFSLFETHWATNHAATTDAIIDQFSVNQNLQQWAFLDDKWFP